MARAIFLTTMAGDAPKLPPWTADVGNGDVGLLGDVTPSAKGDPQLYYTVNGVRRGGFVCVSYAPDVTVLVMVDSSEDTLDAMAASEDYAYVEDVAEEGGALVAGQAVKAGEKKPKKRKQDKDKIKAFLKAKGRKSKDVDDALTGVSAGAIRQGLCTLHKLSLVQFQGATLG